MARYIDADRLSKQILDSWYNDNHRTIQASAVHRQEHHHLMRMIEKQPAADVVPKSEVERLQGALKAEERHNELTMEMAKKALANAKSEVASEIFEEIEKAHDECIWMDITTRIGYLQQTKFEHKLAELKKKYKED